MIQDDTTAGPRQSDAISTFIERFAADLTEAGMQRMASRVFACLVLEESGGLTSAQLAERLQVSPAAISGAVRYLAQVHMLSREREPGSRRERYQVHTDVWYEALTSRDAVLRRWVTTFNAGIEALGPEHPGQRWLINSRDFLEFLEAELSQITVRWRAHRAAQQNENAAPQQS